MIIIPKMNDLNMLPPLNALRAFEVAARHLSFTRAAKELRVRQPAVSRQIAELEQWLGQPLFIRRKPRLELTSHGQLLFSAISSSFEQITQAVQQIRKLPDQHQLVVDVSIGIASCWLMARLADFRKQYPQISLQLITRDSNRGFNVDATDVVVMFGEHDLPGYQSTELFKETLFPICAPGYLKADKRLSASALAQQKLLYLRDDDHKDDWPVLFLDTGVALDPPAEDAFYNSYIVYLQAALNAEGIALGWQFLMSDLLSVGRLRIVSDLAITTGRGYHCCILDRARQNPHAGIFVQWLKDQVDQTPDNAQIQSA